jgi:hypothetical protein
MRLCRFNSDRLGLVEGDQVLDVTSALQALPDWRWGAHEGDRSLPIFLPFSRPFID